MNLIDKVKILVSIRKPLGIVVSELSDVKRGWKTIGFWITFLGSLIALVSALTGFMPATAALLTTTSLTVIYNIASGLRKADEVGVRPVLQSTEFWVGVLNSVGNGLMAIQTGGISPEWLVTAQTIIASVVGVAQNLGAQQPLETSK